MTLAYLGLGGNVGDARTTMDRACILLQRAGAILVRRSSDYETPPWGKLDQPAFVNSCVAVDVSLSVEALLALCLATEEQLGRHRVEKWGPRTIDIDILTYGDEVIDLPHLKVPHPFILERAFVLVPLAEIAPDVIIGGVHAAEAAARIDQSGIVRLSAKEML